MSTELFHFDSDDSDDDETKKLDPEILSWLAKKINKSIIRYPTILHVVENEQGKNDVERFEEFLHYLYILTRNLMPKSYSWGCYASFEQMLSVTWSNEHLNDMKYLTPSYRFRFSRIITITDFDIHLRQISFTETWMSPDWEKYDEDLELEL
jgi:hypothetical protein